MAKKIKIKQEVDPDEDPKVVAKVDEMMDPDQPQEVQNDIVKIANTTEALPTLEPLDTTLNKEPDLPPLDIFADAPSAPLLNKKSHKTSTDTEENEAVATSSEDQETNVSGPERTATDGESTPYEQNELRPNEFDDAATNEAIDDIVAREGDAAMSLEDSKRRQQESESEPVKDKKGHPFFWSLVFIVCILAIGIAVFLADPQLFNPLSRIHWNSIRQHL